MKKLKSFAFLPILFLSLSLIAENKPISPELEAKAKEYIKNQPLEFIENKGQITSTDGRPADNVLFKTSYGNCEIYITSSGLSYVFVKFENEQEEIEESNFAIPRIKKKEVNNKVSYYRLDMNLEGAVIDKANIIKEQESKQGYNNYFYPHCPDGIYGVKAYGKVTIKNVYNGIDWVIYTNTNSKESPLKYDFVIHPNADYKDIKIRFLNAQNVQLINDETKLKIQTIAGNIEEGDLNCYMTNDTLKQEVNSKYKITSDSLVCFELENYDETQTLVIDPLVWATYYGGNDLDGFRSVCVDDTDNLYITGYTASSNFPLMQLTGVYWQPTSGGNLDAIILKFNSQGILQWSTFYGGDLNDNSNSISINSQGDIYIFGNTASSNFPVQQLAGAFWQPAKAGIWNIFILKFNKQGIRQWATYYGGTDYDFFYGHSFCIDSHDNIIITGYTESTDFPIQQLSGAYWQPVNAGKRDVFILKFDKYGVRQWATYYGGSSYEECNAICLDKHDNIYIVGGTSSTDFPTKQLNGAYWQITNKGTSNAFILKFNDKGEILWATYFGGISDDIATSICVDSYNNVFITGIAYSSDFPTCQLNGSYWQLPPTIGGDLFISKFNSAGFIQWSTFYGGTGREYPHSIRLDKQDNLYITGYTNAADFPLQQNCGEYWQEFKAGMEDVFILKFNNQGVREMATYYGSSKGDFGADIAVDSQNSIYFIGEWTGVGAYTVNNNNSAYYDNSWGGLDDSYILKFTRDTVLFAVLDPIICNGDTFMVGANVYTASGTYIDTLTNNTGCDSIITTHLTVTPLNTTISAPVQICEGESISLFATGGTSYYWIPPYGLSSQTGSSPLAYPDSTTTYYVTITDEPCYKVDSVMISVTECPKVYFPNSFTPDGDGINDLFMAKGIMIESFHMIIFDRWEDEIFESNDIMRGWDGTYKGEKCSVAVFSYKADIVFTNGEKLNKIGSITLLR